MTSNFLCFLERPKILEITFLIFEINFLSVLVLSKNIRLLNRCRNSWKNVMVTFFRKKTNGQHIWASSSFCSRKNPLAAVALLQSMLLKRATNTRFRPNSGTVTTSKPLRSNHYHNFYPLPL